MLIKNVLAWLEESAKTPASIYQLKITLTWLEPPIWRRVLAPAETYLLPSCIGVMQAAMGWEEAHLHQFMVGRSIYSEPEPADMGFGGKPVEDESKAKLSQVAPPQGDKFLYEYDFGDGWLHILVVEEILDPVPGQLYPVSVAGERACPPEGCGGPPGYDGLLEALADPKHPEREESLDWLSGEEFDPEAFDLEQANAALRRVGGKAS